MSDHDNFDLITFALLLEKAKGDRSINQYANIIDVSSAHISRLLRKLIKSPPTTIYSVYGKIASIELFSDIKVTIAVSTKKEFDLLINKPPKSL